MSWDIKLLNQVRRRSPDFVIGADDPNGAYMLRWYVIPRNKIFNIYLHCFLRSDEDFALHDHPWLFNASRIVEGWYWEHTIAEGGVPHKIMRDEGTWKFRWGRAPHRVELENLAGFSDRLEPCWTLFFTGPVVRVWGFHCPKGWIPFNDKITRTVGNSSSRRACP